MSLLTDIRARLVADPGVSALTTRISMSVSNQSDALPRAVLHQIGGRHEHHMAAATGIVQGRVQIDCHAESPVDAEAFGEAVRQSLDGYRGAIGSTFVSTCHLSDERQQTTPPIDGRDQTGGIFTKQLDFNIGYGVSVPTFS